MFRAAKRADVHETLTAKRHVQTDSFVSSSWLLLVVASCICLSLGGHLLHSRIENEQLLRALGETTPSSGKHHGQNLLSAEDFRKCNTAMPPADLSGAQADRTLSGERCGWAEAASIAEGLRSAGYDFDATTPQPYIFSGYLQQALLGLNEKRLVVALKHLQENAPKGHLGTLVKFFAWGLPVASADLEAALHVSALDALLRCQLLAPCSHLSSMTTSTAMLFPVPNSTLLMATDWPSRSTTGMSEEPVPIVSPEAMALVFNSPPPKGLNVLDLDSGTGVHGMVAAQRGASSVTLFFTNARAMRFAQFSAVLNGLAGMVSSVHSSSGDQAVRDGLLGADFGLVLAQPTFLPVLSQNATGRLKRNGGQNGTKLQAEVLKVALQVTTADGLLALVSDFGAPFLVPGQCSNLGLPGFKGSLVMQHEPLSLNAFANAHKGLGAVEQQVSNLMQHGVTAVATGLLFARRAAQGVLSSDGCGPLGLETVGDPLAWPQNGQSQFERPCSVGRETACPEIA